MVSGIGPSEALQALGVPILSDLPGVGKNMWARRAFPIYAKESLTSPLQDQTFYGVTYRVNVTTQSSITTDPAARAAATQQYLTNQTGRLSSGASNLVGECLLPQLRPLQALLVVETDNRHQPGRNSRPTTAQT